MLGRKEICDGDKEVQTSSYKINESWCEETEEYPADKGTG